MGLVFWFPEWSLSSQRLGPDLQEVPAPVSPGGFSCRGFRSFSEVFGNFPEETAASKPSRPRKKETSWRLCDKPPFGGMSWQALLAFDAKIRNLVGSFSMRISEKCSQSAYPKPIV